MLSLRSSIMASPVSVVLLLAAICWLYAWGYEIASYNPCVQPCLYSAARNSSCPDGKFDADQSFVNSTCLCSSSSFWEEVSHCIGNRCGTAYLDAAWTTASSDCAVSKTPIEVSLSQFSEWGAEGLPSSAIPSSATPPPSTSSTTSNIASSCELSQTSQIAIGTVIPGTSIVTTDPSTATPKLEPTSLTNNGDTSMKDSNSSQLNKPAQIALATVIPGVGCIAAFGAWWGLKNRQSRKEGEIGVAALSTYLVLCQWA